MNKLLVIGVDSLAPELLVKYATLISLRHRDDNKPLLSNISLTSVRTNDKPKFMLKIGGET